MKTLICECGKLILVDDDDFDNLKDGRWRCSLDNKTVHRLLDKIYQPITLFILGKITGCFVDHKDRDIHNNQKANLRFATRAQNGQNAGLTKRNKSGYKGVSFCNKTQKWISAIRCNGKTYYLGDFFTPEAAAKAYNEKARELHGEFAFLNPL